MSNEISVKNASCTKLTLSPHVQLSEDEKNPADFKMEAYTGEVVDRWWGKLAIDLSGISAANNMPILLNHESNQIVGYSTETWTDGSFFVSGKFSKVTKAGRDAQGLAGEGFPWQASIGVYALQVLQIEQGETYEVNGKQMIGPGEVWLKSRVKETSFVPLGADENTSVSVFSYFEEKQKPQEKEHENMSEEKKTVTIEILSADHPDLVRSIQEAASAKAAEAECLRVKSVFEQMMPGHEDLIHSLMFDGKTTGPEAAVQVLAAEKKTRAEFAKDFNEDAPDAVPAASAPEAGNEAEDLSALPLEKQAAKKWEKSADLRREFDDDFEAFKAFHTANAKGQVRIIAGKK